MTVLGSLVRSRARFQASGCPSHQAIVRSSVVASGSVSRFAENFPTRCPLLFLAFPRELPPGIDRCVA